MTKTILFAAAFALFTLVGVGTTPAQACDTCGCSDAHAHPHPNADGHAKKPCEKTLGKKKACCGSCGEGKPCTKKLGKKEPCEKTLGKKKACCGSCGEGKPCTKKLGKKTLGKTSSTTDGVHNHKGSFTFKSKQSFPSRDAKYN